MSLHVNQTILGAVQEGRCSKLGDVNPYEPDDKKRYLGWEQGHKSVLQAHEERQRYKNSPWYRKVLCKLGIHNYSVSYIPGRPHINPQTGNIIGRDPIITKYTCVCCSYDYCVGLYIKPRRLRTFDQLHAKEQPRD